MLTEEDDFMALTERAFNPPLPNEEKSFGEEWWRFRNSLEQSLNRLCDSTRVNSGDMFTLASDYGLSRHIQFEVRSIDFLNREVVEACCEFVANASPDYEVLMEHDLYLDDQFPDCGVLFRKSGLTVFAESDLCLERLGLK